MTAPEPLRGDRLYTRLGYRFQDPTLLQDALTHRSVGSRNNERLEFLGDAILSFVMAEILYRRAPRATEGELSRLRASLVRGSTLADIARGLDLGEHLVLGSGELKSGGYRRESILADAFEAVLGAIYLDGGFEVCRQFIHDLFRERLARLPSPESLKDPKTRLQEWLQSRGLALPDYEVVEITGEDHDRRFTVSCRVSGLDSAMAGRGTSRRKAEQAAAAKVLARLTGMAGIEGAGPGHEDEPGEA
jgi:ribonuclease-3